MAGFNFEFTYTAMQEPVMRTCLTAARTRASRVGLSWWWRHISLRHCVVLVNGNSRKIDLLGYRLKRGLPLIAEGCAAADITLAKRTRLGREIVDLMLRGATPTR